MCATARPRHGGCADRAGPGVQVLGALGSRALVTYLACRAIACRRRDGLGRKRMDPALAGASSVASPEAWRTTSRSMAGPKVAAGALMPARDAGAALSCSSTRQIAIAGAVRSAWATTERRCAGGCAEAARACRTGKCRADHPDAVMPLPSETENENVPVNDRRRKLIGCRRRGRHGLDAVGRRARFG